MLADLPSQIEISRIIAMRDQMLRNLLITQTYHELSRAMQGIFGFEHANWCSFATWASKQAGHTIRGEDLPQRVHQMLDEDHEYRQSLHDLNHALIERFELAVLHHAHVGEHLAELMGELSGAIAAGNLKVFAELAPIFKRFIELSEDGWLHDDTAFAAFLTELVPEETALGGQPLLRSAFANYRAATLEPDAKRKMEFILTANVQIGLHEQTRLQPDIAQGLEAPVSVISNWLRKRNERHVHNDHHEAVHAISAPHHLRIVEHISRVWREHATNHVMTLKLPGLVLHLGHDVPTLPGRPMFPDRLEQIQHEELIELARAYDHSWNTTVGSGATDWTQLEDRMHYIVDLFRSRHCDESLHEPPFEPDQVHAMRNGTRPAGAL